MKNVALASYSRSTDSRAGVVSGSGPPLKVKPSSLVRADPRSTVKASSGRKVMLWEATARLHKPPSTRCGGREQGTHHQA